MSKLGGRKPVKIVIINTQYVETDAESFKSVVQKLTGKDAIVAGGGGGGSPAYKAEAREEGRLVAAVLDRNWSIREIERWMSEMPSVDELCQSWS